MISQSIEELVCRNKMRRNTSGNQYKQKPTQHRRQPVRNTNTRPAPNKGLNVPRDPETVYKRAFTKALVTRRNQLKRRLTKPELKKLSKAISKQIGSQRSKPTPQQSEGTKQCVTGCGTEILMMRILELQRKVGEMEDKMERKIGRCTTEKEISEGMVKQDTPQHEGNHHQYTNPQHFFLQPEYRKTIFGQTCLSQLSEVRNQRNIMMIQRTAYLGSHMES
jgi:hypothetical protein